jgi:hypothetical protein
MAKRLSNIFTLPAPGASSKVYYDAPDAKGRGHTPGFGVRVTSTGGRAFVLNYRAAGRERRLTIGSPARGLFKLPGLKPPDSGGKSIAAGTRKAKRKRRVRRQQCATWPNYSKEVPARRPSTRAEYEALIKTKILPKFGARKVEGICQPILTPCTVKSARPRLIEQIGRSLALETFQPEISADNG